MKKIILSLLCLLILGCAESSIKSDLPENRLKIATVIYPNQFLIQNLVKDIQNIEIYNLAKEHNLHDYKPSAKDLSLLFEMDLIFIQSRNLESFVWDLKDDLEAKGISVIEITQEANYHSWINPSLALQDLDVIYNPLLANLNGETSKLIENYQDLSEDLEQIRNRYLTQLTNCELKQILVSHNFLDSFGPTHQIEIKSLINEDHFVGFSAKSFVETLESQFEYVLSEPQLHTEIKQVLNGENQIDGHDDRNDDEHDDNSDHGHSDLEAVLNKKDLEKFKILEIIPIEDSKVEYFEALNQNLETLKTALKCQL